MRSCCYFSARRGLFLSVAATGSVADFVSGKTTYVERIIFLLNLFGNADIIKVDEVIGLFRRGIRAHAVQVLSQKVKMDQNTKNVLANNVVDDLNKQRLEVCIASDGEVERN